MFTIWPRPCPNAAVFVGGGDKQRIHIHDVHEVKIENLSFANSSGHAVLIEKSARTQLAFVDAQGGKDIGIAIRLGRDNTVSHSRLTDNRIGGISIVDSPNTRIIKNAVVGNGNVSADGGIQGYGVQVFQVGQGDADVDADHETIIASNVIEGNFGTGVVISNARNTTLAHNIINGNGDDLARHGILISDLSDNTTIDRNHLIENIGSGIRIEGTQPHRVIVRDNRIDNNSEWGVENLQPFDSEDNAKHDSKVRVIGNTLTNNQKGEIVMSHQDVVAGNNLLHSATQATLDSPIFKMRAPASAITIRLDLDLNEIDTGGTSVNILEFESVPDSNPQPDNDSKPDNPQPDNVDEGAALPLPEINIAGRNVYIHNGTVLTDKAVILDTFVGVSVDNVLIHFDRLDRLQPQRTPLPPRQVVQRPIGHGGQVDDSGAVVQGIAGYEIQFKLPLHDEDGTPMTASDFTAINVFRTPDPLARTQGDLYSQFVQSIPIEEILGQPSSDASLKDRVFTIEDRAPADSPMDIDTPLFYYLTAVSREKSIVVAAKNATAAAPNNGPGGRESEFSDDPTPPPVKCVDILHLEETSGNLLIWEPVGLPGNVHYNIYKTKDPALLSKKNLAALTPVAKHHTDPSWFDPGGTPDDYYYISSVYRLELTSAPGKLFKIFESAFHMADIQRHRPKTVDTAELFLPTETPADSPVRVLILPVEFPQENPDDDRTTGRGQFNEPEVWGDEIPDAAKPEDMANFLEQFFHKSSRGKLTIEVDIGPKTVAPAPMSEYAPNLDFEPTRQPDFEPTRELARFVTTSVNLHFDFSPYDQIVMVTAGAQGNRSHDLSSVYLNAPTMLDCKRFLSAVVVPESQRSPLAQTLPEFAGTLFSHGVAAHELGHAFRGKDLYLDEAVGNLSQIGAWGIMGDTGPLLGRGRRPVDFSAWNKLRFGWYDELQVITKDDVEQGLYVELGVDKLVLLEITPPVDPNDPLHLGAEYFLIENRQRTQELVPGDGILIWLVTESQVSHGSPIVRLREAHGGSMDLTMVADTRRTRLGDDRDPFYLGNNSEFSPTSDPNSHDSHGNPTWVNIFGISASQDVMSFYIGEVPSDLYVAPDGSDETGSGQPDNPFATIDRALGLVDHRIDPNRRVTIHLQPGVYTAARDTFVIASVKAGNVTIRGDGTTPADVVLDGGRLTDGIEIAADHVRIEHLTIRKPQFYGVRILPQQDEDQHAHAVLRQLIIEDSQRHGVMFAGHDHTLTESTIRGSRNNGVDIGKGTWLIHITDTQLLNNGDSGVLIGPPDSLIEQFIGDRGIRLTRTTIQGNRIGIVAEHYFPIMGSTIVKIDNSQLFDNVDSSIEIEHNNSNPAPKNATTQAKRASAAAPMSYQFVINQSEFLGPTVQIRNGSSHATVSASNNYWGTNNPDIIASRIIGPNIDIANWWASRGSSPIAPELSPPTVFERTSEAVAVAFAPSTHLVDGRERGEDQLLRYRIYRYIGDNPGQPYDLADVGEWHRIDPEPHQLARLGDGRIRYLDDVHDTIDTVRPFHLTYVVTAYLADTDTQETESVPSNMHTIELGDRPQISRFVVNHGMELVDDFDNVSIELESDHGDSYCINAQAWPTRCAHCSQSHESLCSESDWKQIAELPPALDLGYLSGDSHYIVSAWVRDANRRVSLSRKSAPIGKHLLGLDVLVSGNVKHHGDAVDFGSQQLPIESTSRVIRFEIVNTGSDTATIDSATLSSQHFSVPQWSAPKTIEPGERLGLMIHPGVPVEIGDKTAIFTLSTAQGDFRLVFHKQVVPAPN